MNDQIALVKDRTDIVAIIGERVKLNKAGSNFRALCPFHSEKSPSFFVNPGMQRYMCFGCHETGDCFTFLEKHDNMTFAESLKYLAQRAGIELKDFTPSKEDHRRERILSALSLAREYYHYLLTEHKAGEKAREYLAGRGTTAETIKLFGLGVSLPLWDGLQKYLIGKKGFSLNELLDAGLIIRSERGTYYDRFRDRLMFPLTNQRGVVVGFSGRSLNPEEKTAKYINSPETEVYHKSELLFGYSQLHRFIREKEEIILVEGEFDALSSFQAHVNNTCAIKGSALTEAQLKLLSRSVKRIIFALDNDKAGQEATKRAITMARDYDISLRVILLTGGKDPDDIARENPKSWREMVKKSVTVFDYLIDQAFLSHDATSGDGKREITNELGPLIIDISNGVEQAHYLQKIAKKLDVTEDLLLTQFRRKYVPAKNEVNKKIDTKPRQRVDVLEEYLFSILFHLDLKDFVLQLQTAKDLITSPGLIKILGSITYPSSFNLNQFSLTLPEELKLMLFSIYMEGDQQLGKANALEEFHAVVKQIKSMSQKKERENLGQRITELEEKDTLSSKEQDELKELQSKMK